METVDVTIIGAGVVGLSVAAHTSVEGRDVVVVERRDSFGQEASSRNSEVVHAGIYYKPDSLKGRLCHEGNELMYALCRKHAIPCRNNGKLIVAVTKDEEGRLESLLERARKNGAGGVRIVSAAEIEAMEPNVRARAAIYCPTSGIVDSHGLMVFFRNLAIKGGAVFSFGSEVQYLSKESGGFKVGVIQNNKKSYYFRSRVVVNCAGMCSGRVAAMAGIDVDEAHYRIHYRKGVYFRVTRKVDRMPSMLIYPPPSGEATVGIHTVPDLGGGMRLGPYDYWCDEVDYSVDASLKKLFFDATSSFLPTLAIEDLEPDTAGIQSKRYGPGEASRDFVIRNEADRGLDGLIDLIGIESPGLTSSPAIGRMVAGMVDEIL